jgi:hypothetical protein
MGGQGETGTQQRRFEKALVFLKAPPSGGLGANAVWGVCLSAFPVLLGVFMDLRGLHVSIYLLCSLCLLRELTWIRWFSHANWVS